MSAVTGRCYGRRPRDGRLLSRFGCHRAAVWPGWIENRTHPGRLRSDLQTVLKTAGLTSASVRQRSPRFRNGQHDSMLVRPRPLSTSDLAVILAVAAGPRQQSVRTPRGSPPVSHADLHRPLGSGHRRACLPALDQASANWTFEVVSDGTTLMPLRRGVDRRPGSCAGCLLLVCRCALI